MKKIKKIISATIIVCVIFTVFCTFNVEAKTEEFYTNSDSPQSVYNIDKLKGYKITKIEPLPGKTERVYNIDCKYETVINTPRNAYYMSPEYKNSLKQAKNEFGNDSVITPNTFKDMGDYYSWPITFINNSTVTMLNNKKIAEGDYYKVKKYKYKVSKSRVVSSKYYYSVTYTEGTSDNNNSNNNDNNNNNNNNTQIVNTGTTEPAKEKKKEITAKKIEISDDACKIFISELYNRVLKRTGTEDEITFHLNVYKQQGLQKMVAGIILSDESIQKNGQLENSPFIKNLYSFILNRNADQNGLDYFMGLMDNGYEKEDIIIAICNSDEFAKYIEDIEAKVKTNTNKKSNDELSMWLADQSKLEKIGDVDGDGVINACDASLILKLSAQLAISKTDKYDYINKYADIDENGKIDTNDASIVLIYSAYIGAGDLSEDTDIRLFYKENIK